MREWAGSIMWRFCKHFGLFSCLLSLLCCPLSAQTAGAASEVSTTETAITFTTGINLVPVKVVVRGKDGRAVGNLTQADFELTDNGKAQTILRFSIDQGETQTPTVSAVQTDIEGRERPDLQLRSSKPAAVIPERFVAYVFDDVHTAIGDLIRAREAATKHMEKVMEPATRVGVFTISGVTKLDFTDDLALVRKTIESLRLFSANQNDNTCPSMDYFWADMILNKSDAEAFAAAVQEIQACMGGNASSAGQLARSNAISLIAQGQYSSRMGLRSLGDVVGRLTAMPGKRSIVYVSSGFFLDPELRYPEGALFDKAIRAGVLLNSLDARGLFTVNPAGDISKPAGANTPLMVQFLQRKEKELAMSTNQVMAEMANATGGQFAHNSNDYQAGFERVAGAPEYTYVLSFAPTDLKSDGKFHQLKVRLKNRGAANKELIKDLELFTRNGYYAPSAGASAAETVREEIRDAVFSRDEPAGLPVDLSLQYFKTGEQEARLTVIAKLDVSGLKFRKGAVTAPEATAAAAAKPATGVDDGDKPSSVASGDKQASNDIRNNDIVTVISVVFDRNGNFVKGVQRVLDMKLKDKTLEQLLAQGGITVRSNLELEPGSYFVRLVVRDSEGRTMAARNGSVEIPD